MTSGSRKRGLRKSSSRSPSRSITSSRMRSRRPWRPPWKRARSASSPGQVAAALALPVLEERIEGAAPLLELGERRALAALLGGRRRRGRQRRGQRRERARPHSEARAKPVAPASLASPSTRTTSPSTTCRSPASTTTLSGLRASVSRSTLASDASSLGTGRSLTNTSCAGVMVTSTPFGCSSFSAALGRSTSEAGFTMAEVVIMKMMRRTRNTSVSGVTLISATMRPRVCPLNSAMAPPRRRDRLDQPRAADAERPVDALHAVLEVVVEDERDDADGEAERGGDERLGDAARHHAEAARADDRHAMEGAHDADHRAEEPDEGRRGADRAEDPKVGAAALHLLELPLVGHALELLERRLGGRAEHVAEHAPRRAEPVPAHRLGGAGEIAARQQRDQLGGERAGRRHRAAQRPQALEHHAQHDD